MEKAVSTRGRAIGPPFLFSVAFRYRTDPTDVLSPETLRNKPFP